MDLREIAALRQAKREGQPMPEGGVYVMASAAAMPGVNVNCNDPQSTGSP